MSVYQKFIASASPPRLSHYQQQNYQHPTHKSQAPLTNNMNHNAYGHSQDYVYASKVTMMRQHSKVPSVTPPVSSTPARRQQLTPMVESNRRTPRQQPSVYGTCTRHPPSARRRIDHLIEGIDDPLLLKWLQAMRFETELECLSSLQARSLAVDEFSAGALSVRNSQVNIQETRSESNLIIDIIDHLIDSLPIDNLHDISKFSTKFSELWTRIVQQTASQPVNSNPNDPLANKNSHHQQNNLTIINCTPRKAPISARTLRPLDQLAIQIRGLCLEFANSLNQSQDENSAYLSVDSTQLESSLRRLKLLYGHFVEVTIRAECVNIVRALNYDFSKSSLNRLSSSSMLLPVRPFESNHSQLPLKWALIALWQLTKDDSYICRTLTEEWQTESGTSDKLDSVTNSAKKSRAAKRLDYSTKYDSETGNCNSDHVMSLRFELAKLNEICQNHHGNTNNLNQENQAKTTGALKSALRHKSSRPEKLSAIELLIDIIISQPNKHERLDIMNFVHLRAQRDKLIDVDEWDQSLSAEIYTSNQYKVAALRILTHLCVNEQAVRTILKCFSTPPPSRGQPIPENKIIRSIFECYQTAQEHIYQNDNMIQSLAQHQSEQRKRSCRQNYYSDNRCISQDEREEYSDYGSRQTNSIPTTSGSQCQDTDDDQGDDGVVKEAIRLLIQLTTVFHSNNQGHDFYTLIGRFSIESLVKYLTNIIKSTSSREMLLLSFSALANISFITCEPMIKFGTNRFILELFSASKSKSKDLELRDQAVTILANTASKNILDIVTNGGLTFLLSCLESCPTKMANYRQLVDSRISEAIMSTDQMVPEIDNKPRNRRPIDLGNEQYTDFLDCACDQQQDSQLASNGIILQSLCLSRLSRNELAAMERIHQKAAVALVRMSADTSTTHLILKYGGIKQLIDLCKFSHKRNYSDTVLVACIVALRKMAKTIDRDVFKHYNALDLIELDQEWAIKVYRNSSEEQNAIEQSKQLGYSDV